MLARDRAIEVAGPILTQSTQLTEEDLLACANGNSQEWLLAISKRASLSQVLGDLLVTQGNPEVVHSVAKNEGAQFSSAGFGMLVEKSKDDEALAGSLVVRKDIPQKYAFSLACNASEGIFKDIVHATVLAREAESKRDYKQSKALFESILHSGKPIEHAIYYFAMSGKLDETIVGLSVLCHLPIEAIGKIMVDKRVGNDRILIFAKYAGLPWQTAKLILQLRWGESGLSPEEFETARQYFDQLESATVQRLVRFYQVKHGVAEPIRLTP